MNVSNVFPKQGNSGIAVIGEAPGEQEARLGIPFVGASGRRLDDLLRAAGASRQQCFVGNVCQQRPPDNKISGFEWSGDEIQEGIEQLKHDLLQANPNIIVLMGATALKAARDPLSNHPLIPKLFANKIGDWRGSLFIGHPDGPFAGRKCIATYHPAFALRVYENNFYIVADLKRAVSEATTPDLLLPHRDIIIATSFTDVISFLDALRINKTKVSVDIEGGLWTMSCISFSVDPWNSFVIPFIRKDHTRWWPKAQEFAILCVLCEVMMDPTVGKIWQNGLYDRFVLQYAYHMPVLGNVDDTMLAAWEMNSELPKALAMSTSLYTREPFYKQDRRSQDDDTFYRYCGKDSAVTYEIANVLNEGLKDTSLDHYALNKKLLDPLLDMQLRGIAYDSTKAAARRALLLVKKYEAQARLNALTGHRFTWRSWSEIDTRAKSVMLTKKGDRPRKAYEESYDNFRQCGMVSSPSLATIGEIEDLCEVSLNVDTDYFKDYLYDTLGLPKQYNTNRQTGVVTLTTDYEALLKLSRHCQKHKLDKELQVVQRAIEIRALITRTEMLSILTDLDGRIRCSYNLVGTETGRIACYSSITGSGYNLQTIPKYTTERDAPGGVLGDRDLFLADPDHWFFQCDLSGADGWTVAAYSAFLGDPTMLDDYRFGLKPAKILTLLVRGVSVDFGDRDAIKEACKKVDGDDWDYFANKRIQHGSSYGEGKVTISRSILKDSEGKLYLEPSECERIKQFFFVRYPGIKRWHNWLAAKLAQRPVLQAASGQVRRFYGRPDEIATKAMAFEPQANTTYATNLALHNLWTDPDNQMLRLREGNETLLVENPPRTNLNRNGQENALVPEVRDNPVLRIEPLHQVHDALCGQFSKLDTAWATARIRGYFDNPLIIAGQNITIPFEGGYGTDWQNLKEGKI